MDYTKIIESIDSYLENGTDYAIMISGEWGVGKTYFLKSKVLPKILEKGKRPIYVSLIGLSEEDQLEKLIFEKINPFHFSKKKSHYSIEADFIESIINESNNTELNIPDNLVLCFDDLERIKPEFFEAAIGYINLFIEHYKTKCIFLCNEDIIEKEKRFSSYNSVKEKYIRFTFSFKSDLKNIIEKKIKEMKLANSEPDQTSIILNVFKKGNTSNIRTLLFILSIYKQVNRELNKIKTELNNIEQILSLILSYCCFYAIESRQGSSYMLLDKITINNSQDIWKDLGSDTGTIKNEDSNFFEESQIDDEYSDDLAIIQNRYFNDDSFKFERFDSVAELIKTGYLDTKVLELEVKSLDNVLDDTELIEANEKILKLINNVWTFSDLDVEEKVTHITDEAEKGKFDLQTYLRLYRELLWWESFKIKGVNISGITTDKFKRGAEKAVSSGKLRFVHNLMFQIQWEKNDKSKYGQKFRAFASYIDSLNKHISDANESSNFQEIPLAINSNNIEKLSLLSEKEAKLTLTEDNATIIYESLNHANANTTNHFYYAMVKRYENYGSTISEIPKIEKKFILKLFNLLESDEKLDENVEKTLSRIPLIFLRQSLKELIKYHFPETQSKIDEKQ